MSVLLKNVRGGPSKTVLPLFFISSLSAAVLLGVPLPGMTQIKLSQVERSHQPLNRSGPVVIPPPGATQVGRSNQSLNRSGPVVIPVPGTVPLLPVPRVPAQEIRGVWLTNIDSDVLFSPQLLQKAIQDLAQLKFNTLYPVVWNWGYTQYPSQVAKRAIGQAMDPRPKGLRGRNVLAELIQQGRKHGMTVIPWFEFGFMTTADSELATRKPDWITQRRDGSKIWPEGQHQRLWLNPFKPEVQQFIQDLILEIVTKYQVDGIQFDDHMGLPSEFGYDPYTVAVYKRENNGKAPPTDPKDPQWLRWRADKITEFMGRVVRKIKARKPSITISIAPNPQSFSYENYLQDWNTWRRLGYVQELILQVYRTDMNAFTSELLQPEVQEAKQYIPVGIGVLTGLKNKPIPMSMIQEQVQVARDYGFLGVSFFFYETLWNLTNESTELRKGSLRDLFTPSVPRPSY